MGIDHIENLVNMSIENIKKDQPGLIESGQIKLVGKNLFHIYFRRNNVQDLIENL